MEKKISKDFGSVYCNTGAWEQLEHIVSHLQPSKIFVVTDTHTAKYCLPHFRTRFSTQKSIEILQIDAGEEHKNIETCLALWQQLSNLGADRKSLVINLGGGVVTDLGGFVACTYQRGIEFINIPTSLLAMVDASVGGKNGVDLGALKNQIGVIKNPKAVIVDTRFLLTLPEAEFNSGTAEMIKHGFIASQDYLDKMIHFDRQSVSQIEELIWESIQIKNEVISKDPLEQGLRKKLNYGHTLGHAIESYCLKTPTRDRLLHGEAIAIGMILATYISSELLDFPKKKLDETSGFILKYFKRVSFSEEEIREIIKLLIFDKKNRNGNVQFVLLENIGSHRLNCSVPNKLIYRAFKFYNNFHS